MAFNPVDYLKEGKVDFVFGLTLYDKKTLVSYVRESKNKIEVIHGFLELLKDELPRFCFSIIYDEDVYKDTTLYLMKNCEDCILDDKKIKNILEHTVWGREYILEHIDTFILKEENYKVILEYIFYDFENNMDFVQKLCLHNHLHARFLFMKALVENQYDKVKEVYDDILKYVTSSTYQEFEQMTLCPTLMDIEDISSLAISILDKAQDKKMWTRFKEYIINAYEENDLATKLLELDRNHLEFQTDSDLLFSTSRSCKFYILKSIPHLLSKEMLEEYTNKIKYFRKDGDYDSTLASIYGYELGRKLERYTEEYLEQSKNKTTRYVASGSTSSCYQIGDYVIKLFHMKWSYEEVICPNLYLFLRNLEEEYVRDERGHIVAGIEVQKYLEKSTMVPYEIFGFWKDELKRLGYYLTDTLVNGKCGDNCRLLDSYREADYYNPEMLPDWFKEYPLVSVDRDRVYQLTNEYPKQIKESWRY